MNTYCRNQNNTLTDFQLYGSSFKSTFQLAASNGGRKPTAVPFYLKGLKQVNAEEKKEVTAKDREAQIKTNKPSSALFSLDGAATKLLYVVSDRKL